MLEEQPILERAQARINQLLRPVVDWADRTGVKDVLHGRQVGHALHPIATDATIGFWTSALVLDFVGARKSARFLTGVGNASALVTAASGVADWTVTDGRERRLGLLHGLMNVAGLGCQTIALFSPRRYRSWSMAGFGISMAAAYIGGELVYGRAMMVNHDAWLAGPSDWKPVCRFTDVPDGLARAVEVDGRKILVRRAGMVVSAMENACAHLGGPLDEGEIADGVVTCPWHGSQFRLSDGGLIKGPSCFPQLRLEARVRDGIVEIRGRAA
ncbi:MAG TPA: Rieske (2Fe-2S) protein [Candidatus Dormibacteraeota bacterium]|nr:Rieske (2Fe-2S) protein [Candidatus Dormibacteraeota bacterium]